MTRKHCDPKSELAALAPLGPAALGLIDSSVTTKDADLHEEIIASFVSTDEWAVDELTGVLRTAHERFPRGAGRTLGLQAVHARCVEALATRLSAPERARDDWSIHDDVRCRCGLCATLTTFLRAPGQARFEWPLAKDHRAHIHRTIDNHGLPVTHVTRRTGRPFTLVLEKTQALFERDVAARAGWRRDLAWLTKTAAAFCTERRN